MALRRGATSFGSVIAAWCFSPGCGKAPLRSPDGSRSALPVATAYRKTCPAMVLIRCADSRAPRLSTRRRTDKQLRRFDFSNGPLADPGEKITLQAAHDRGGMARRPCRGEFRMPFAGYDLEGFRFLGLCLLLALRTAPGSMPWAICLRASSRRCLASARQISG